MALTFSIQTPATDNELVWLPDGMPATRMSCPDKRIMAGTLTIPILLKGGRIVFYAAIRPDEFAEGLRAAAEEDRDVVLDPVPQSEVDAAEIGEDAPDFFLFYLTRAERGSDGLCRLLKREPGGGELSREIPEEDFAAYVNAQGPDIRYNVAAPFFGLPRIPTQEEISQRLLEEVRANIERFFGTIGMVPEQGG